MTSTDNPNILNRLSTEITMVAIEDLTPHPKNMNSHPEDQLERLEKIIRYQGFKVPIIVSTLSGHIVSGHGRLMVAERIGLGEVPVIYAEFKDEDEEYAFIVSENAISEWSELDLKAINASLENFDPSFDLDMLGLRDFVLDPSELPELDSKAEKERDQLTHILEVHFNSEDEMLPVYEELLARGLIVRSK